MKLRMSLIMAGVVAFTTGCAAGGGSTGGTTAAPALQGEALAQGERERQNDMTRAAARALEDAQSAEDPSQVSALYQQAVDAAADAIAADPTNPLPHLQSAYAYVGLGDYENAAMMFDEAESLRPIYELETERIRENAWIALYSEGAPLVNSGQYEQAISLFRQADMIYGERPEVKLILGQLLVNEGDYDGGIEALEGARMIIESDRINEMDSTVAADWRNSLSTIPVTIATAYLNSGRLEEAKGSLQELLQAEPNNTSYLNSLANVFVRMEMPDSANAVYDRLLSMDGLDGTDYYNIGVGRYQGSDFAGAAEAFERATQASTNDRDSYEMWARSLQIANQPVEGEDMASEAVLQSMQMAGERWKELDPNNQNAFLIIATAANRLGDSDTAQENVAAIEALPFTIDNLQIQRDPAGGGLVVGVITNKTMGEGQPISLEFTFYDAMGGVIGTETVTTPAPAAEGTRDIRVDFLSDAKIHGYGYSAGM